MLVRELEIIAMLKVAFILKRKQYKRIFQAKRKKKGQETKEIPIKPLTALQEKSVSRRTNFLKPSNQYSPTDSER